MDRVLIYGLGKEFEKKKNWIRNNFEIVACTDSICSPKDDYWKSKYKPFEKALPMEYDYVLICTKKYFDSIKICLINEFGIDSKKIRYIDTPYIYDDYEIYKEAVDDLNEYKRLNKDKRFSLDDDSLWLITQDKRGNAGNVCPHYFAMDIWGARRIYNINPIKHYDIGSRLDGFISHLLSFRDVYYIDIRPLPYDIPNLHFTCEDATCLSGIEDDSIESLSCLHALEHFGLGRYGDRVDPEAYIKLAESMKRVLKPGGHLYIAVPIGSHDYCMFNAHRVFRIESVIELFSPLKIYEISVISPDGVEWSAYDESIDIKDFSCGLFDFIK